MHRSLRKQKHFIEYIFKLCKYYTPIKPLCQTVLPAYFIKLCVIFGYFLNTLYNCIK